MLGQEYQNNRSWMTLWSQTGISIKKDPRLKNKFFISAKSFSNFLLQWNIKNKYGKLFFFYSGIKKNGTNLIYRFTCHVYNKNLNWINDTLNVYCHKLLNLETCIYNKFHLSATSGMKLDRHYNIYSATAVTTWIICWSRQSSFKVIACTSLFLWSLSWWWENK